MTGRFAQNSTAKTGPVAAKVGTARQFFLQRNSALKNFVYSVSCWDYENVAVCTTRRDQRVDLKAFLLLAWLVR